ncbi:MAG: 50S ribosomal protein L29 [Oscillospiraceae bacterium]|nr:50S ribosomal protein L29 [Oscillospiraceae bacterium]
MKASEVRNLSNEELEKKVMDLKKDLFNLRLQHATNQLENPIRIAQVKKDIARVKTVLREQQLAEREGG